MNNRDPFGLRKPTNSSPATNIFRSTVTVLEHKTRDLAERGRQSLAQSVDSASIAMSSYAPPNGTTHRHAEHWHSAQSRHTEQSYTNSNGGGITEKVSEFFASEKKDSLPMYKDKPYAYPGRRKKQWWQQRRYVAGALVSLAVISWWFGILSPLSYFTSRGGEVATPQKSKSKSWFSSGQAIDWDVRAEKVRETFKTSFAGYEKHAWGYDEYHPVSHGKKQMTQSGMGWIIVDALDTMMLMNLTSELTHARQWIHESLKYDQDHDVNTFETTIRMLGGLLSAHYLSTEFPNVYAPVQDELSDDLYIETAMDLADRLLGAYDSKSGIPYASINLHSMQGIPSHADGGASSTAEATSLQLEMKYLAKLTGEEHYWEKAEHVMKKVDDNMPADGLVPIFISAETGTFRGDNIRLGSRGDSYYEYLIKQYLQTSQQEPVYQAMWNESMAGMKKHLLTYSSPNSYTVLAERPNGLKRDLSPKMDHLVCFVPGTIALATTGGVPLSQAKAQSNWGAEQEEDMRLAEELMKTCWGMYKTTPTGLAGEITFFNLQDPPIMYDSFPQLSKPSAPDGDFPAANEDKSDFIVKAGDAHNLQRPETVESLFYMWRITGEEKYREWGWEMFESFVKYMEVDGKDGYSSLSSVLKVPPGMRDNMESFWLVSFSLLLSPALYCYDYVHLLMWFVPTGRNAQVLLPALLLPGHPPPHRRRLQHGGPSLPALPTRQALPYRLGAQDAAHRKYCGQFRH